MKSALRNNLKGLKKEEEKEDQTPIPAITENMSSKRMSDIIPVFSYGEDIRKIDLIYNVS